MSFKKTKKEKFTGAAILFLTSIIWGFSFCAQVVAGKTAGPFCINAIRMALGTAFLMLFLIIRKDLKFTKPELLGGVVCGFFLFAASAFQQFGINMYSGAEAAAGKAGFITSLYILLVPVVLIFFKQVPKASLTVSLILAVPGLYLLCVKENTGVSLADLLLFMSAVTYSFQIIAIDRYSPKGNPVHLSVIQLVSGGVFSLICALIFEKNTFSGIMTAMPSIVFIGIFSSGIAYTLQIVGQRKMGEAAVASVIMSLESVFAAISGALLLGEVLTLKEIIGAALVFIAVLTAQLDFNQIFTSIKNKKSQKNT